ncbi:MAG: CapA family protein [Patescibacteria group bacterium]|jgi:poly-gamma-glutamate synthesis protein (capsule biosynthesis protein)
MKKYYLIFIVCGFLFASVLLAGTVAPKKIRHVEFLSLAYNQMKVFWEPKDEDIDSYKIRLEDANRNLIGTYQSTDKFIVLSELNPETKYFVKIKALRNKQKSKWSVAKPFTTRAVPPVETTAIFAGDVMMSRYVGRITAENNDWDLPFHNIAEEFAQNNLAFVNMEAPFKETGPYYVGDDSMTFKVDPQMIAGLQLADIDIVSLANNHILNAGQAGLDYTRDYLADNEVAYCYDSYDIREVNGLKFGFLCYSYDFNLNTDDLVEDINEIKDQADVLVVSMHNGAEYTETISSSQSNFAHTAIENGADLVIGHHPHVVQGMEEYKGKYIFYSLGNLVFDQSWSWPTQLGAAVKITWEDDIMKKIEFKPIKIDGDFQPRFMDFEEGKEVLGRLQVDNYEIIK